VTVGRCMNNFVYIYKIEILLLIMIFSSIIIKMYKLGGKLILNYNKKVPYLCREHITEELTRIHEIEDYKKHNLQYIRSPEGSQLYEEFNLKVLYGNLRIEEIEKETRKRILYGVNKYTFSELWDYRDMHEYEQITKDMGVEFKIEISVVSQRVDF
jgi:hypothetical protein